MEHIGAFEAKTHLSALLDRVSNGERITITRHGVPAAVLVPASDATLRMTHEEIVDDMRALRRRVKSGGPTIREMIDEGRRLSRESSWTPRSPWRGASRMKAVTTPIPCSSN